MDSTVINMAAHYKPNNTFEYLIVMCALCLIAYFFFNKKGKNDGTRQVKDFGEVEQRFKRDYDAINELKADDERLWLAISKQADNHLELAKDLSEIKGMLK